MTQKLPRLGLYGKKDKDDFAALTTDYDNPNSKFFNSLTALSILCFSVIIRLYGSILSGAPKNRKDSSRFGREDDSNVKFGHFSYTPHSTNRNRIMKMFQCARHNYGCKAQLHLPNSAVDEVNLAIMNYEAHNHSVSFNIFFTLINIQHFRHQQTVSMIKESAFT
jgi:hypothetical protein